MPKIFVSYRREDTAGHAGRLCDVLHERFGQSEVFHDVDSVMPGEDFVTKIQEIIPSCDFIFVIIGRQWIQVLDQHRRGVPDYVRMEVALALDIVFEATRGRSVAVIPVLVNKAEMPPASQLPPDIAKISSLNAFEISDRNFHSDAANLVNTVAPPPVTDRNWRYNEKIPVQARILGDRIAATFKAASMRGSPVITDRVQTISGAYYAITEKVGSAQRLVSVFRHITIRTETIHGTTNEVSDKVFSRNLIWESSSLLSDVQSEKSGNARLVFTEITEEEAYRIVNRRRLLADPDAS